MNYPIIFLSLVPLVFLFLNQFPHFFLPIYHIEKVKDLFKARNTFSLVVHLLKNLTGGITTHLDGLPVYHRVLNVGYQR